MKRVIVIAPHPDDETLGCGGTLLRHKNAQDEVHWVIVTGLSEHGEYSAEQVEAEQREITHIAMLYQFDSVRQLNFPPAGLDTTPMRHLITAIGDIFNEIVPEVVYVPFRNDIHTDHRYVFDAAVSCTKCFRYPSVKRILTYETLSETDFSLSIEGYFQPNVFVDITNYLDLKLQIMNSYKSEMGEFPFPRSDDAIIAQAKLRGVQAGCFAGEAFMLLKEII